MCLFALIQWHQLGVNIKLQESNSLFSSKESYCDIHSLKGLLGTPY